MVGGGRGAWEQDNEGSGTACASEGMSPFDGMIYGIEAGDKGTWE